MNHPPKKKLFSIFAGKKTDNKAFEFSPTYLRIQKQAPTNFSRLIGWSVVAFVTIVLLWSYLSYIAIYANTTGKLIVSGKSQKIQPLNPGKIEKIYVKEGQVVQKGDLLVQLSDIEAKTNIANLKAKLSFYQQNQKNFEYIFPIIEQIEQDGIAQNISIDALQNRQATLDLEEFFKQIAQINAKIHNSKKSAHHLKNEIKLDQLVTGNARRRVEMFSQFFNNQDISELQFLQAQKELLQSKKSLLGKQSKLHELNSNRQLEESNKKFAISQKKNKIYREYKKNQLDIIETTEALKKYQDQLQTMRLYAPIEGFIQEISINTIGGVVTSAQELMSIVPIGKLSLQAEVKILNKDVGFVRTGQAANVQLDAFNYIKYGAIDGVVENIYQDSIEDKELGYVFLATVNLKDNKIQYKGKTIFLHAGLSVVVRIKTGRRRVIDYLLSPVLEHVSEGLKER
ncbi:Type I secretion system, membrane fusion protein LapC [Bathymodiolus thermophilus thioautotrophic gill symbiont]|uniref:Membrane fusion protein (MFP) family protein n=1 Tax=Bathymodiolus thermophilus thioautotrophic gill symbiont TaxID=2360 RepID=A0A1J5U647_9GAMM|nr:HlyD family type I secretion periplasmic adaptor subunit [Bathymodiolus thermophilus thioautotrophic gill symbiont]AYQ56777.1 hypothetical protein MS2017_1070 [Bathymodiolus thermophilus thioautotrophic gill symbiont]OIR23873.1 hypothetical protein BGC33_08405 [Bathymodiolus thermophilus thioautotrophic gill symbiont]SHA30082.1 Type I secretion system, membrane fusion protein LapC [Bathymodiolus thermophilus thioautotrophic gill symbiont]